MIITIGSRVKDKEGQTYLLTEELGHILYGMICNSVAMTNSKIEATYSNL